MASAQTTRLIVKRVQSKPQRLSQLEEKVTRANAREVGADLNQESFVLLVTTVVADRVNVRVESEDRRAARVRVIREHPASMAALGIITEEIKSPRSAGEIEARAYREIMNVSGAENRRAQNLSLNVGAH